MITPTSLQADVLWSTSMRTVIMTELSVPWADRDGSCNQEEEGKIHRFSICMLTIMVEGLGAEATLEYPPSSS